MRQTTYTVSAAQIQTFQTVAYGGTPANVRAPRVSWSQFTRITCTITRKPRVATEM